MIVEKIITITEEQEINITGATLLSIEEYNQSKNLIPCIYETWWLRSTGVVMRSPCVNGITICYSDVSSNFGVRPALNISNFNLQIGDKFKFANHIFTVINEKYALCDNIVGRNTFRDNWKSKDANDYKASDIKRYVDTWFNKAFAGGENRCR